jgi:hypothetical protein
MSQHTPGPWDVDTGSNTHVDAIYHQIDAGQGFFNPFTGQGFGLCGYMSLADAKLISAAPELLHACKDILDFLRNHGYDTQMVRSAIAKAEGR